MFCHSVENELTEVLERMRVLFYSKKFADVVSIGDEALTALEKHHNAQTCVVGEIYSMFGYSLLLVSNYKKSLEVLLKGKSLMLQARDTKGLADVCDSLGACYTQLARHEDAVVEYEQALAANVDCGNKCVQASCQNNLATSLVELKRFTEARVALERCWTLSMELNTRGGKARTCTNLGWLFLKQGRVLDGIDCLRKGVSEFNALGLDGDMARASLVLGKALMDFRDMFPVRMDTLQEIVHENLVSARKASVRDGLIPAFLASMVELARLEVWRGDEEEAVKQLEQHLDAWVVKAGPNFCSGCMQRRTTETPMLVCAECRVARYNFFVV